MIVLTDRDGMVALELNQSLWKGICENALRYTVEEVRALGLADADRLSAFASTCENPQGQRASLCRAIVQLIRFAPGNVLAVQQQLVGHARGFWERTG